MGPSTISLPRYPGLLLPLYSAIPCRASSPPCLNIREESVHEARDYSYSPQARRATAELAPGYGQWQTWRRFPPFAQPTRRQSGVVTAQNACAVLTSVFAIIMIFLVAFSLRLAVAIRPLPVWMEGITGCPPEDSGFGRRSLGLFFAVHHHNSPYSIA